MAKDGSAYKQAYREAAADLRTEQLRVRSAKDRYEKNPTPENEQDYANALQDLGGAKARELNAAADYRVYTDRKMLPDSMGADKVKEAILQDPCIKEQARQKALLKKDAADLDEVAGTHASEDVAFWDKSVDEAIEDTDEAVNKQKDKQKRAAENPFGEFGVAVGDFIDGAVQKVTDVTDVLTSLAEDAGKKIAGLFGGSSEKNNQSKNLSGHKADKGQKETDVKVKQVDPDNHAAMKTPNAYKTKPKVEVVEPSKSAPTDKKKDEKIPEKGPLKKAAAAVEKAKGAAAEVNDVVASVTKDITGGIKAATDTVKGIKKQVNTAINDVKKGLNDAVDGAMAPVREALGSLTKMKEPPLITSAKDILKAGKELSDELSSALPGPLGAMVKTKSDNFFNKAVSKITNNKLTKFQKTFANLEKLTQPGAATNAIGKALLKQAKKKYPNLTDENGLSLTHLFGDSPDKAKVDAYYEQAAKICPNITKPTDTVDYGDNKALYDSLLTVATEDGVTKVLEELLNCSSASTLYFDGSSVKVLQESAKDAAQAGDVGSYKVILVKIGQSNLPNAKQDVIVLIANNNTDEAIEKAIDIDEICAKLGVQGKDLLVCGASIKPDGTVYDAATIRLATANNTYVVDKYISEDNRKLVQAAIALNGK